MYTMYAFGVEKRTNMLPKRVPRATYEILKGTEKPQ